MSSASPTPGGTRAPGATPHAGARARLGYNGQLHEPRSCSQILGNGYREYNPVLRRFHSPDSLSPFGEGGINAYAYCEGDPVNHADPSGHFLVPLAAFMGIGAVGVGAAAGVMAVQGKSKEAGILGAIAGALGAISMVAAGMQGYRAVSIRKHRQKLAMGEVRISETRRKIVVDVHGNENRTWVGDVPMDATEFSALIKRSLKSGGKVKKNIHLLSCGSADGLVPQGQVISNRTGMNVTAYRGDVAVWPSTNKPFGPYQRVDFQPQTGITKAATNIRNTELNRRSRGLGTQRELRLM